MHIMQTLAEVTCSTTTQCYAVPINVLGQILYYTNLQDSSNSYSFSLNTTSNTWAGEPYMVYIRITMMQLLLLMCQQGEN